MTSSRSSRTRLVCGLMAFAGVAAADVKPAGVASPPVAARCPALSIEPDVTRVASGGRAVLRARGGSGRVTFALSGDLEGAWIEPGGELRAGPHPARFNVTVVDATCGTRVTSGVEVVEALGVEPHSVLLEPSQTFHFEIRGGLGGARPRLLDDPRGAALSSDGEFRAPAHEGHWSAVATDPADGQEVPFFIEVTKKRAPFHARSSIVALARGARVPLRWSGGSGVVDLGAVPPGATLELDEAGEAWLALTDDAPPSLDVRAVDRATGEQAHVHVVVAPPFGGPLMPRGTRTRLGDIAVGDVNGDGRADLLVGHAERANAGIDAGGLLVFPGVAHGFAATAERVVDGDRAGDHFGATLLVRDVTGDGVDDVLVAAPDSERGAVHVFVGGRAGLGAFPARVLMGDSAHDHFGRALAVRDIDGDGSVDLVVTAPDAKARGSTCEGGRAFVFRGESNARGVFEAVPWQTIELRDALSDDPEASVPCSPSPLDAGASLAIVDMDRDGRLDLVVGEPRAAFRSGGSWQGAVDVYRGGKGGLFSATPTWSIHPDRSDPPAEGGFGGALDVVATSHGERLIVRGVGPQSSGFRVFAPGSLGEPASSDARGPRVRVVTSKVAVAAYAGKARGDIVVGDFDGDGHPELLVTDTREPTTRLLAFRMDDLMDAKPLKPVADLALSTAGDDTGASLAAWGRKGDAGGLALFAPERTTSVGPFVGAVDVVVPGVRGELAERIAARAPILLPQPGAGDRTGAHVALVRVGHDLEATVGAPGASAGSIPNAGRIDRLKPGGGRLAPLVGSNANTRLGLAAPVPVDFDGDGTLDLAVGDMGQRPSTLGPDEVDPDRCLSRAGVKIGSGFVHVFAKKGDAWFERARIIGGDRKLAPSGFGSTVAAADMNGDGKGDLIVGRLDGSEIEVVPGRAFAADKVVVACRSEDRALSSLDYPGAEGSFEAGIWWAHLGTRIASLGDVDRDGCDDVTFSIVREGKAAGTIVAFGYDASRARCRGHDRPLVLHLVSEDRRCPADPAAPFSPCLMDDLSGRMAGTAIASGGDLTGDGVLDLAFGDEILTDETGSGPAVEIVSGAFLASVCPNHVCPKIDRPGTRVHGESVAVALSYIQPKDHVVVRGGLQDRGFGAALASGDLDGDGHLDLAVGAPEGSEAAPFAGTVEIFRGPFTPSQSVHRAPWVWASGDGKERGEFGASVAVLRDDARAWLLVGAPGSTREGAGVEVGAAYLFGFDARNP